MAIFNSYVKLPEGTFCWSFASTIAKGSSLTSSIVLTWSLGASWVDDILGLDISSGEIEARNKCGYPWISQDSSVFWIMAMWEIHRNPPKKMEIFPWKNGQSQNGEILPSPCRIPVGVWGMVSRLPIYVPAKAFPLKWIDSQKRTESQ